MYSHDDIYERQSATRGYFYTSEADAVASFIEEHGPLPTKYEVCDYCNGEGTRALGGACISGDALDDHEFMSDYFNGAYDTKCEDCKGLRVIKVIDLDRMQPDMIKLWKRHLREIEDANAESLAEMRYGC
jgi:hypothetical protein